jgi:hypothetical protein
MIPNWFATTALLLWPLFALWLFQTLPVNRALTWTILGGQLLLPVGAAIKFEGIPGLDKISAPSLAALAGCAFLAGRSPRFVHRFGLTELLLLMYLIGPFITSELNGDAIFIGDRFLPPIDQYEALSVVVGQFLFILPFFLGRHLLRTSTDTMEILRILVIAGLLYSFLMLLEIRMSPQLHRWIYGYSVVSFAVEARYGGFRPGVFMTNGLVVAFFAMTTVVAAAAFWRTHTRAVRMPAGGVVAYLGAVLVLCKAVGALIYGAASICLISLTKPRLQIRIALVLVTIALVFPILRTTGMFPTGALVDAAKSIDADRAASLEFRFIQEDQLLEHALQRPFFGWGRFARNRVYDDYGKDVSITDGHWIIMIGEFGIIGFIAEFGLLILPVFRSASAFRFTESPHDQVFLATHVLILAINVVDLLPNAPLTPWTWLLAGALLGRADAARDATRQQSKLSFSSNLSEEDGLGKGLKLSCVRASVKAI